MPHEAEAEANPIIQLNVRVPQRLKDRCQRIARDLMLSTSDVSRIALKQYCDRHEAAANEGINT